MNQTTLRHFFTPRDKVVLGCSSASSSFFTNALQNEKDGDTFEYAENSGNDCDLESDAETVTGESTYCMLLVNNTLGKRKRTETRQCQEKGCTKQPSYGLPGKKPRFCVTHKQEGMFNVVNKRCEAEGCGVRPSYGLPGEKPRFCAAHKQEGMMNIKSKRCEAEGCTKQPSYGLPGEQPRFCAKHKQEGMINVVSERCEAEGCSVRPSCGLPGEKPRFCAAHKQQGMTDVKNPQCEEEGCSVRPSYGLPGENARFCATHKQERMVDVVSKQCEAEGCTKHPNYGLPGEKPRFCTTHKQEGMMDIKGRRCKEDGCTKRPSFGYKAMEDYLADATKAEYCFAHKRDHMVNVNKDMCSKCKSISANPSYRGYCSRCFCDEFPDEASVQRHGFKEQAVVLYVQTHFSDWTWVHNKSISGGCSTKRPDLLVDLGTHVIIVEVDENQHKDYLETCEAVRCAHLWNDLGERPLVFLRFNPDEYCTDKGTKVSGCWGDIQKEDVVMFGLKPSKKKEWKDRLQTLQETIHKWKVLPTFSSTSAGGLQGTVGSLVGSLTTEEGIKPSIFVQTETLFYDGYVKSVL